LGEKLGSGWTSFWEVQQFFAMLIIFYVGRGTIADDLRSGALTLYFSRPISFRQYLLGKWSAVAICVVAVTLLPGLVLCIFRLLAEPHTQLSDVLNWLMAIALCSSLLALTSGMVVMAISALSPRGSAAGLLWVALFIVLGSLASFIQRATGNQAFEALSFNKANLGLLQQLLDEAPAPATPGAWLLLSQLGWTGLSFLLVLFRLRRWKKV
jgi:ABC-type transport system involved in multi-copper enzyme maturation permease subunit